MSNGVDGYAQPVAGAGAQSIGGGGSSVAAADPGKN